MCTYLIKPSSTKPVRKYRKTIRNMKLPSPKGKKKPLSTGPLLLQPSEDMYSAMKLPHIPRGESLITLITRIFRGVTARFHVLVQRNLTAKFLVAFFTVELGLVD